MIAARGMVLAVVGAMLCATAAPRVQAQSRAVTYAITTVPAFPAPTAANYGTGAAPGILANSAGMTLNVAANVRPEQRTATLAIRATAATVAGPWAKPVNQVSACWSTVCGYVPLSTTFQNIATVVWPANGTPTTPYTGTNILFRVALRWESDLPGAYTLGIESRLTVTSP